MYQNNLNIYRQVKIIFLNNACIINTYPTHSSSETNFLYIMNRTVLNVKYNKIYKNCK